ncbi:MAG: PAQR family membrane homeostasis protein TrhA [Bacilli bacterium]
MKLAKESTLGEEIFNAITHGVGAILSIVALVLLLIKAESLKETIVVTIFSLSSLMLYLMSTLFHSFPKGTTKNVFQRFDHLAIYLMIAGTYTPFSLLLLKPSTAYPLLAFQWVLAIVGIILKAIWVKKFKHVHIIIFLLMGWSSIVLIKPIIEAFSGMGVMFLLLGGISYSIGVIFYVFSLFKFHHAIWHLFVMLGTFFHFLSLYFYLL